jgi:cyclic pyranopterin phosphate synthase
MDPFGGTRMVDVSPKEATLRRALARCRVAMKPETTAQVANNAITKGDVLAAARFAGIQAAKRTADLIPTSKWRRRSRRWTGRAWRWRR